MPKLRVLIVDDSVVMRRLITEALIRDSAIEIAGTAPNGRIALQKIEQINPDAVTMDVEMPELDGLDTLRQIKAKYDKLPVIMFSSLTQKGAAATLEALAAGASDYVAKPSNVANLQESLDLLQAELVPKIKAHCKLLEPAPQIIPVFKPKQLVPISARSIEIVCIGSSTGGPVALEKVLCGISSVPSVPIAIVQHMPPMFTQMLAKRIDGLAKFVRCKEATDGVIMEAGTAYVAPGGRHLTVVKDSMGRFIGRLTDGPPENSCRPAVDVLFKSIARIGANALAVVLTGMGQDGLRGCEHISEISGQIIVQDQGSSVVWGMPGAVAQAGIAGAILSLNEIALEITRRIQLRRTN